jgi:hypothetical protein
MSDLTASVTKDFHYTSPVFDVDHSRLADIYERWGRVLIVIDTSEC